VPLNPLNALFLSDLSLSDGDASFARLLLLLLLAKLYFILCLFFCVSSNDTNVQPLWHPFHSGPSCDISRMSSLRIPFRRILPMMHLEVLISAILGRRLVMLGSCFNSIQVIISLTQVSSSSSSSSYRITSCILSSVPVMSMSNPRSNVSETIRVFGFPFLAIFASIIHSVYIVSPCSSPDSDPFRDILFFFLLLSS